MILIVVCVVVVVAVEAVVNLLPRQAFVPRRPSPITVGYKPKDPIKSAKINQLYRHYEDHMMLVYARPKPAGEVDIKNPQHFAYFVKVLLKKKPSFLVKLFEEWCPGSGLGVVQAGFTIFTLVIICAFASVSSVPASFSVF